MQEVPSVKVRVLPRTGNVREADVEGAAAVAEWDAIHLQHTWQTWDAGRCSICLHSVDSMGPQFQTGSYPSWSSL
jgi:hypothetical protein